MVKPGPRLKWVLARTSPFVGYCDNGVVLAGTGSNTGDAYIYKSIDYGQTWTQIAFDTYSSFQTVEALCYLGNGIVLGGGGNTTLRGSILRSDVGFSRDTAQGIITNMR